MSADAFGRARFLPCGDSALTVEFGDEISPDINRRIKSFTDQVELHPVSGVLDVIPTYRSVTVVYDPLRTSAKKLTAKLQKLVPGDAESGKTQRLVYLLPVCYEKDFAPDMANVEKHTGLSREEIVSIHTGTDYLIYMLGFLPGFPYLGGLDARLHTPRLEKPRTRIEPGSVGIGGKQTGVYPLASPGGWQLIGRTPVKPYDPKREKPILYKAGDCIRFFPVTAAEYETIASDAGYEVETGRTEI